MFYALLPFLVIGFVAVLTLLGSLVGLLIGGIASIDRDWDDRIDRSSWEPSHFFEKPKPPSGDLDEL